MERDNINKDRLLDKITHSRELTALEKRYLENLVGAYENPTSCNKECNKVGHWILTNELAVCTNCRVGYDIDYLYGCSMSAKTPTNYCPNCGADMRGDKDGR